MTADHDGRAVEIESRFDAVGLLTVFLVLLIAIPGRLVVGPLGAAGTPAAVVALIAAWIWVCGRVSPKFGLATGRQPVRIAVLVFAWSLALSFGVGYTRHLSPGEASSANRSALALIGLVGIALLAADGIHDRESLERLLRRIVTAGGVLAAVGIAQFFTGFDIATLFHLPGLRMTKKLTSIAERSQFRRVAGTALHPIEFGVVLAMILPLALHFAFYPVKGLARWRPWFAVALIAIAIPLSVSRSSVLGVLAGLLILAPTWTLRRQLNVLVALVLFAGVFRAVIPGLLGTFKSLFLNAGDDPSVAGRTNDYALVGEFVRQRPFFGRGYGTFIPSQYFFLDNQYLGTLIGAGFVGLIALSLLFLVGMGCARGARHRSSDPAVRDLGQSLAACIGVAVATFFTFDGLAFRLCTGMLFLLIGCAGALWRIEAFRKDSPSPTPVRREFARAS